MGSPTEGAVGSDAPIAAKFESDEICTVSWILWSSPLQDDSASIHEEVDKIFSHAFSFYPEQEWKASGYPPPQGRNILGAWRDPQYRGFVFLMDNPGMTAPAGTSSLLLTYAGARVHLTPFLPCIENLKKELLRKNGRRKNNLRLRARLKQADTSKSLRQLMALMGPITAVINGLALYLHRLTPPVIEVAWLARMYNALMPSVYIAALLLLLVFTVLCILYICKYGTLLLRKL